MKNEPKSATTVDGVGDGSGGCANKRHKKGKTPYHETSNYNPGMRPQTTTEFDKEYSAFIAEEMKKQTI